MRIAFFGSSLVSAFWNGAATYYRGIIRALAARGHHITFYEPDAYQRQQHRDIEDPSWATVAVYAPEEGAALAALADARNADVIVKASGVGIFDALLEEAVAATKTASNQVVFWDVDAPATLDRVNNDPADPFQALIPRYDAVFTYGGGDPVVEAYRKLGARECIPVYNGLDPETHYRVTPDARFEGHLAFLGNRLPDRERRVEEFFLHPAARLPEMRFLLGGAGWADKPKSANLTYFDHVYTCDHNAFNSTPNAVINISRESMARYGYSPATRVFEAAGAGACTITDEWLGIDLFFEPGEEILVAADTDDVVEAMLTLDPQRARQIGEAAQRRALAHHTYAHRAELVERILEGKAVSAGAAL
ncbi:MAG TPA: glycosyltransferase [Bryobacteraceae bacterium]|jgi:spore maturation protein CgeB|nr:glycosyltransferase [Bryobacteraceae bacterium]